MNLIYSQICYKDIEPHSTSNDLAKNDITSEVGKLEEHWQCSVTNQECNM